MEVKPMNKGIIDELKELKQVFEKLYEERIKNITGIQIIWGCKQYFNKERNAQELNTLLTDSQELDLKGIIELIEKKVELLDRNEHLK